MQVEPLLQRGVLEPAFRPLIGVAVATWRADWSTLQAWVSAARTTNCRRRDLEETLLQCVLFCGFPRVITAFEHFVASWPSEQPPEGGGLPEAEQRERGDELFRSIYGKNDRAVRELLQGYHQELHDFVLEAAYGRILTRPGLTGTQRELIAVAVLAAQDQKRQFAGHARGSMHLGATVEEVRESLVTAFGDGAEADEQIAYWMSLVR